MHDTFFGFLRNALFLTPENGVIIKGKLSEGPAKRADRALQKVVRTVLHITSYERVCSSHSLKLWPEVSGWK